MSNAVFPTLPGLKWGLTKTPVWSTKVQQAASGRELRASYFSYPLWKFSLGYEVLRANALAELQTLIGFFNARQGSFDSFLYEDPDDKSVSNQVFGVAATGQTQYQLARDFGGFVEPVIAPKGTPVIMVAGVPKVAGTDYTISSSGLVNFITALTAGQSLSWTGEFYFRCRFLHDTTEFEQFMRHLWAAKKIEFQSVKL